MKQKLIFMILTLGLFACSGLAGDMSVRLVSCYEKGSTDPAGIEDVVPIFERSFGFSGYKLDAAQSTPLPADHDVVRVGPYKVRCNGGREKLLITVLRGKKVLVSTTVKLKEGKPFILGEFPAENGKQIIVFLSR